MEGKTLKQLFIPISFEILCYMLTGVVDTMMISTVGDNAVGAVGTSNTYLSLFIITFSIISSGMIAVMTQYIGAGHKGVARQAKQIGLIFNIIIGVLLSVFLFFFSGDILNKIGISEALAKDATEYMEIVGGGCILMAVTPVFAGYLRSFGFTKLPLYATIISNIINIIFNAVFLFIFDMGVMGVALATVISRIFNMVMVIILAQLKIHMEKGKDREKPSKILKKIIMIGLPSALETAAYNVSITLVMRYLNGMDGEGINVTIRSYANQIASFSYCIGAGLAQANAIMTGWFVGAGKYDECDKTTRKAAFNGIIVAAALDLFLATTAFLYMPFFTNNKEIIGLVCKVMFIDIILEVGRVTNLVYGNALKTSGDVMFPLICAVIVMFAVAVGGTYIFGIKLGLLVVGAYIGLAADEFIRGICVMLRWRSGVWRKKNLLN